MVYNELEQGDILSEVRVGLAPIAYTDILLRSIWAIFKIRQTPASPQRQPAGVSARARPSVQPGALPTACAACRPMWGGSRRRNSSNTRLVPQPANPHVGRLSMSSDT